ncbi:MAG TPA: BrnA antitoxin family protein [Caulobacteraceae bacterium]|jgi:uncharacterized protein (DUF4415 family)|nr:BrnA antitoxin family protein [Caulobacteraceae bacterium]
MSSKGVTVARLDPTRSPKLTEAQQAELKALAAKPDGDIDVSGVPVLPDAFWENAVSNPFYKPLKKQLTVRLDADVLAWLRAAGAGYQSKLNSILRQAMLKDAARR